MTKIKIIDGTDIPHPEDRAMLQALYSRSPAPVEEHIEKIAKSGSGKFMGTYYVGYGHESIGELGDITIFLEGVSMAAAKAFQDNPLYRGQECSTRYIDFSTVPFYFEHIQYQDKYNKEAWDIQDAWRTLYVRSKAMVREQLVAKYTRDWVLPNTDMTEERANSLYAKTIEAITFDLCRGLLPIGATTSVAWSGDLRTVGRHCRRLMMHPLAEVRNVSSNLYAELLTRYPNSFKAASGSVVRQPGFYYIPQTKHGFDMVSHSDPFDVLYYKSVPQEAFAKQNLDFMSTKLQHSVMFHIRDNLDYASYRDLQRHRNGFMSLSIPYSDQMPSRNNWYLKQYPDRLREAAEELYGRTLGLIHDHFNPQDRSYQYLLPMLAEVPVNMKWNLHQMIYVCNLRSGVTVHPSLRDRVTDWAATAHKQLGIDPFTLDFRGDYQSTWRGAQDIVAKEK